MYCTCSVFIPFHREWRTKSNLTWNENQTVVHYALNITYTFEPNMSSGDPKKDKIYTLNIPLYVSVCVCGWVGGCMCGCGCGDIRS